MSFSPRALHDALLPPPPEGLNYVVHVRHSMTMAFLGTMFGSFLVPMLIALFFFASQHTCRKTYIFWLNISALVLGILEAIYLVAIEFSSALKPPLPDGYILAWYIMSFYTPVFVESILIFRLSAVYTPETTSPSLRRFVVGFPAVWKIVRFALITALLSVWITAVRRQGVPVESGLMGWSKFPYPKIAWGFQLLDNTFCAIAFLKRLHNRIGASILLRGQHNRGHKRNAVKRLRTIFVIALSNYVVPAVLGVAHLVIAILNDHWEDSTWMYICSYLMIVNNYITIIGVVFATIWATSREWAGSHSLCVAAGTDVSCAVSSPTSSRTATSPGVPQTPGSPKFFASPYPSGVQTPLSPDFPKGHYDGYHQSFKFSPDSARSGADSPLRIHVAKQTSKSYEIEVGPTNAEDDTTLAGGDGIPMSPLPSPPLSK